MGKRDGACLICGEPLVYMEKAEEMECVYCHKKVESYAKCKSGHFVCDDCHAEKGIESIIEYCLKADSSDPIAMLQEMMENPFIYMHGPEHHVMVGAALITAYHNAGGAVERKEALEEIVRRGKNYPGGSCGYWGCCGAAVSVGMCVSIITKATPLSGKSWGLANLATAKALEEIGKIGGPRCCKRNSFTAVKAADSFFRRHFGVSMDLPKEITCDYSPENNECLKRACPYYREDRAEKMR